MKNSLPSSVAAPAVGNGLSKARLDEHEMMCSSVHKNVTNVVCQCTSYTKRCVIVSLRRKKWCDCVPNVPNFGVWGLGFGVWVFFSRFFITLDTVPRRR